MKRLRLLSFIFLLPLIGLSAPVKINGTAPGAEGKRIELIRYADFLTFREQTVAVSNIDSLGRFLLSFDLTEPIYGFLTIDFHRAELFFEPSRTYNVRINPMDYNDMKDLNPFVESPKLDLTFLEDDPTDLNFLVQTFNNAYDDFLLKNFNALYRERNRARVDTFKMGMEATFVEVKNSYFRDHMKYKLAGLYQVTQTFTQQQIGKSYFSDSPVLYMNVEYMKFFSDYFKKYLTATSRFLKYNDYNHLLAAADPYKTLMNSLGTDSILKPIKLRELVLMKGLVEMYNTQGYDKNRILEVLKVISSGSAAMENRKVAENILYTLTKLRPGTPAPPFKLKNQEQKEVTLADFKGKLVILNFWTTYCQGCLTEMDKTKILIDKYKDQVAFISIGADKDFWKMMFYITQKKEYTWNFLHLGGNYELLKDYEVKSYPYYVIIDQAGNINQCPAELPGSGLDLQLQKLLNQ